MNTLKPIPLGKTITGTSAADVLNGQDGADTLDGAAGADTLSGGLGGDVYTIDNVGDRIIEVSNDPAEIDQVKSTVSWTLGTNLEYLLLNGSGAINGTGNALANLVIGNNANNILDGGAGADTLAGGGGNDTYLVDNLNDRVIEANTLATEIDTVKSSLSFVLGDNLENLILTGTVASNGTGNALANNLTGNAAANILNGGIGNDTLLGGDGNDTYVVDTTGDVISETNTLMTEIDTVQSSVTWTLGANLEKLTLTGTAAINGSGNTLANTLTGNSANNTLSGDAGNDIITGGAGSDTLIGGLGNDIYVVDVATDVISETSTVATEMDTVQSSVRGLGSNGTESALKDFS